MELEHPNKITITIDSNLRCATNKLWYKESVQIFVNIIRILNETTKSSYLIPKQPDVIFTVQDEKQLELHSVSSCLLKTLRNCYCIMKRIPQSSISISNAINRKYCLISALNARSFPEIICMLHI